MIKLIHGSMNNGLSYYYISDNGVNMDKNNLRNNRFAEKPYNIIYKYSNYKSNPLNSDNIKLSNLNLNGNFFNYDLGSNKYKNGEDRYLESRIKTTGGFTDLIKSVNLLSPNNYISNPNYSRNLIYENNFSIAHGNIWKSR
ncbi:hypothetical protein MOO46_04925 [Apilactobacillus apisilvae]|uniref:Uncharacterized protein n=1 Tax=Apilactobacillus apisilvae TaxID=2923364 RepID=A0ABY4PGI3_9LACO|nr:hypothetical protein [Apilactobacillus apisilvae]UQS84598.1 hypothetical protein MOO46_04925 [Apilactobacillus apisilvae]